MAHAATKEANANLRLQLFECERGLGRLMESACKKRWLIANGHMGGDSGISKSPCRGCEYGAERAGKKVSAKPKGGELLICARSGCEVQFVPRRRQKYCSQECSSIVMKERAKQTRDRAKVPRVTPPSVGKPSPPPPSSSSSKPSLLVCPGYEAHEFYERGDKVEFCSRCGFERPPRVTLPYVNCPRCDAVFIPRNGNHKFCGQRGCDFSKPSARFDSEPSQEPVSAHRPPPSESPKNDPVLEPPDRSSEPAEERQEDVPGASDPRPDPTSEKPLVLTPPLVVTRPDKEDLSGFYRIRVEEEAGPQGVSRRYVVEVLSDLPVVLRVKRLSKVTVESLQE